MREMALLVVFVVAFVGGVILGTLGAKVAQENARRDGYAAAVDSVLSHHATLRQGVSVAWPFGGGTIDTMVWMWNQDSVPMRVWVPKAILR